MGEPERGKTLFEGVVDSHPKRWDLWSIYIDMEVGQNDIQSMRLVTVMVFKHCLYLIPPRNLFDRVLAQKTTSHKAKYVCTPRHGGDCLS
jgi:rRNA biogenesis protein RRP5